MEGAILGDLHAQYRLETSGARLRRWPLKNERKEDVISAQGQEKAVLGQTEKLMTHETLAIIQRRTFI